VHWKVTQVPGEMSSGSPALLDAAERAPGPLGIELADAGPAMLAVAGEATRVSDARIINRQSPSTPGASLRVRRRASKCFRQLGLPTILPLMLLLAVISPPSGVLKRQRRGSGRTTDHLGSQHCQVGLRPHPARSRPRARRAQSCCSTFGWVSNRLPVYHTFPSSPTRGRAAPPSPQPCARRANVSTRLDMVTTTVHVAFRRVRSSRGAGSDHARRPFAQVVLGGGTAVFFESRTRRPCLEAR